MPYSSDDFEHWNHGSAPVDHPVLQNVDTTGMPTFARLRLQEHIKNPRAPFTSNLSVNELLLARHEGYRPIAQVLGTSVYHVGWRMTPYTYYGNAVEMYAQSEARLEAWRYAVGRLEQQARTAGAHAVLGVRLNRRSLDMNFSETERGDVIEFSLSGTAVRFENEIHDDQPLMSTFSGQEFIALRAAGFYPKGLVFGCCVFYQPSYWSTMQGGTSTVAWGTQYLNQEQTDYTRAFIDTRRTAVQRLQDQAMIERASGVLDMSIHSEIEDEEHEYNDQKQVGIIVTFEAVGTAVVQVEPRKQPIVAMGVSLANPIRPTENQT